MKKSILKQNIINSFEIKVFFLKFQINTNSTVSYYPIKMSAE